MAKPKPNYTELTHQVVRDADTGLTIDEIAARVLELTGGESTKNLKQTIRGIVAQSTAIIYTPAKVYGWKSRLLNGAVNRIVLRAEDLLRRKLPIDDIQRDLLEPNGPGNSKYSVKGLPRLELAGGPSVEVGPIPRPFDDDLLSPPEPFWEWVVAQGAQPGDSLLLTAIDTAARRYGLSYEPAAARDEAAIAERGRQVVAAAVGQVRRTSGKCTIWELVAYLNAGGVYHQIPAPEPFAKLWTAEVWGPLVDEYDISPYSLGGYDVMAESYLQRLIGDGPLDIGDPLLTFDEEEEGPIFTVGEHGTYQGDLGVDPALLQARIDAILQDPSAPIADDDPLLPALVTVFAAMALPAPGGRTYPASQLVELFGDSDEILDWIEHGAELGMVTIDPSYTAMFEDGLGPFAPLPEPEPRSGESRTLVLRVTYRYASEHWREIEIADDQLLSDLHLAIQRAFAWDNDHLYAFYMGKRPYDRKNEIGAPGSDARRSADRVTMGELELRSRQKFLYLFDFGDDHLFDIQVLKINPKAPPGVYPRVVAEHGGRLVQYEGEDDWDEEEE